MLTDDMSDGWLASVAEASGDRISDRSYVSSIQMDDKSRHKQRKTGYVRRPEASGRVG